LFVAVAGSERAGRRRRSAEHAPSWSSAALAPPRGRLLPPPPCPIGGRLHGSSTTTSTTDPTVDDLRLQFSSSGPAVVPPLFSSAARAGEWIPSPRGCRLTRRPCFLAIAQAGQWSRAHCKNAGGNRLGRCASGCASTAGSPPPMRHCLLLSLVRIREVRPCRWGILLETVSAASPTTLPPRQHYSRHHLPPPHQGRRAHHRTLQVLTWRLAVGTVFLKIGFCTHTWKCDSDRFYESFL
jgi:hypothetical protein